MKSTVLCDKCGSEFPVELFKRKDGDLDIAYLKCPHCNEEFLVSVTDSVLRSAIDSYKELFRKIRETTDAKTSAEIAEAARQMKENNSRRCLELMTEYHENKEKKQ